jgi:hypothetical protein
MDEIKKRARKLISAGKTDQALKLLASFAEAQQMKDLGTTLDLLTGRYSQNKRGSRLGIISRSDANQETNRINLALLEIISEMGSGANPDPSPSPPPKTQETKILFLAANPIDTGRLRLDKEIREIDNGLGRARHRDSFLLKQKHALRTRDLTRALLDEQPDIVHFSGHGFTAEGTEREFRSLLSRTPNGPVPPPGESLGIALEDDDGNAKLVRNEALGDLFRLMNARRPIRCVVLNSCFSLSQAEAIVAHIPYVVGMKQAVKDDAAIDFAVGFYDALGAGDDIPQAFEMGKLALSLEGYDQEEVEKAILLQQEG